MVASFPSPVLSVAVDVVRDLDGKEALSGLWNLFTKCKGSLQDGYRLENISWRLWYRELAAASEHGTQSKPRRRSPSPELLSALNTAPLSPVSDAGHHRDVPAEATHPSQQVARSPSPAPSTHSAVSVSSSARPSSTRSRSATSVGQIIVDMIPNNTIDITSHPRLSHEPSQPDLALVEAASSLPTPGEEPVAAPFPSVILPVEATSSATSTPLFPRVVIVNPTPHPTPPATPIPAHPPMGPLPAPSTHLLPPPRAPVMHKAHHETSLARSKHTNHIAKPSPQLATTAAALPAANGTIDLELSKPVTSAIPVNSAHPSTPSLKKDDTLKASDRRFFLQEEHSPSPERESPSSQATSSQGRPERPSAARSPSIASNRSPPEAGEIPSSVNSNGSSQTHASGRRRAQHHAHRSRFGQRAHPLVQRKQAGTEAQHKAGHAKFDVGSTTSDGSRATTSGSQRRLSTNSSAARVSPISPLAPAEVKAPSAPVNHTQPVAPNGREPPALPPAGTVQQRADSDSRLANVRVGGSHRNDPRSAQPRQQPARRRPQASPEKQAGSSRPVVFTDSDEYETTDSEVTDNSEDDWEDEDEAEQAKVNAEESRLRAAALEAQRQRDLFTKLPKRSYSNLSRTRSGLLSQLMNPDPNLFPAGHPVRTASTADVGRLPSSSRALSTSHSATALPQLTTVTAQTQAMPNNHYRPRARPQDQELEPESTDEEGAEDGTSGGLSRSLAQQRLAALADPNRRRSSQPTVAPLQPLQPRPTRPTLPSIATAPIPLNHPWNLPPPAPPMTPRTTRRQMLSTELSESLRRNLLWERQVSKTNLLRGGLRPLTKARSEQPQPAREQQPKVETEEERRDRERAERRRAALARNRSWADDYHYSGW